MARPSAVAVLPPLGANQCPTCRADHETPSGDWPRCPDHPHWMTFKYRQDAGYVYGCPAPKCKHTHTTQERLTMTTEATTGVLAIRDGQQFWDNRQLAALTQLGVDGAPQGDLGVFFHRCQVTGLDPFAGQICMVKRGNRWVIQTEIDGYRVIAHRAAKRESVELSYGPTKWYDRAGGSHDIWLGEEPPAGASLTVYKDGKPFPGVARFKSFASTNRDGTLMAQWAVMPDHMIAKCAEAQALRKAFPHDLEAIYTSDEAAHVDRAPDIAQQTWNAAPVPPPPAQPERRPQRRQVPQDKTVLAAIATALDRQFDRLEIEDSDEREAWVRRLNQDADGDLTADQLRFALATLGEKDGDGYAIPDLAALVELCDPGTPTDPPDDNTEPPF